MCLCVCCCTCVDCDCEIGDERVGGLSAAVAHDHLSLVGEDHAGGVHRLAHRADLIDLQQQRVGPLVGNSLLDQIRVGRVQIVTNLNTTRYKERKKEQ